MPVEINDILLVPVYDPVISNNNRITIKWSENLREGTADYYVLVAKKQSKSKKSLSNMVPRNKVCFIIAAEWYEGESDNPQHLNNVATKTKDGYEFKVDSRAQYGQKNADGDMRFVVYHDKSRKMYQHRFIETTSQSAAAGVLVKTAESNGYGDFTNNLVEFAKNYIGHYLRDFK